MGTIYEKIERMIEIAKYLNASEDTLRAIKLCKADLVSNVINERIYFSTSLWVQFMQEFW